MAFLFLAQTSGLQSISEANGFAIATTGMLIVFAALVIVSTFVALLPKILKVLDPWLPEAGGHGPPTPAEQLPADEEKIVAAIGYVLHNRNR